MAQQFTNNARALLTASITDTATSIVIESAKADLFPVANVGSGSLPSASNWFKATLQDSSGNVEIVAVRTRTAGSGILANVIRGYEGTTARSFVAGTVIGLRITAADVQAALSVQSTDNTFTGDNTFTQPINGDLVGDVTGDLAGNLTAAAPTAPTAAPGTNTTQIATTAFSAAAITAERTATATLTNKSLTSPTLTGTPVAPTASVNTNTTQVATTAFVVAQIADDAPTKTGTGASGTWGIDISGNAATATTATNGFGVGQSWSEPSRSAGVWYQNTTGKPIMVNLVLGSYQISSILVGVSTSVYATANYTDNDIYQVNAMSAVVPNNYYYQSTGAVSYWYELR